MGKMYGTSRGVKKWLAAQLELPDVPTSIWEDEEVKEYVEEYLLSDGPLDDISSAARRLLKFARKTTEEVTALREGGPQEVSLPPLELDEYQRIRADALAAFVASEAARHPGVRAFRRDVLGGHLLTRQRADAFVSSGVLSRMSLQQCKDQGIPPVGHTAKYLGGTSRDGYKEFHVDPPGKTIRFPEPDGPDSPPTLAYPREIETEDGPIELPWVDTYPGSVLDNLRTLCEWAAPTFGWDIPQTARFVLTGARPPYEPVKSSAELLHTPSHRRVGITLRVDARLSDDEVARAYREARRELGVPKNVRATERNLRLFRFVTERTDEEGQLPPWRELLDEWNHGAPASEQYPDVRNFRRDYGRAKKYLLRPTCLIFEVAREEGDRINSKAAPPEVR